VRVASWTGSSGFEDTVHKDWCGGIPGSSVLGLEHMSEDLDVEHRCTVIEALYFPNEQQW